jgi:hypothetical protein
MEALATVTMNPSTGTEIVAPDIEIAIMVTKSAVPEAEIAGMRSTSASICAAIPMFGELSAVAKHRDCSIICNSVAVRVDA